MIIETYRGNPGYRVYKAQLIDECLKGNDEGESPAWCRGANVGVKAWVGCSKQEVTVVHLEFLLKEIVPHHWALYSSHALCSCPGVPTNRAFLDKKSKSQKVLLFWGCSRAYRAQWVWQSFPFFLWYGPILRWLLWSAHIQVTVVSRVTAIGLNCRELSISSQKILFSSTFAMCHAPICLDPLVSHMGK